MIVGVLVGLVLMKRNDGDPGPLVVDAPPEERNEEERRSFLRDGWKAASAKVLTGFMGAASLEEKARYIIGGDSRLQDLREFYGAEKAIDETDTPSDLFSHFDLDIADRERGLFMMQYERPAQYDVREFFRPVAPLEIQHNLEDPDLLLSAFAARENFAMDSVRVMAFFKEVANKLLLDWDVYTQTKYRTLRHFISFPQPGKSKVFRVLAREALPGGQPLEAVDVSEERTFRFSDPAHAYDQVDVTVGGKTTVGQILADLAFVNLPGREPQNRYATVKLAWSEDSEPRIYLEEVICWEFLNLGGVAGNAHPVGLESNPAELSNLEPDPLASAPPAEDSATSEPNLTALDLDPTGLALLEESDPEEWNEEETGPDQVDAEPNDEEVEPDAEETGPNQEEVEPNEEETGPDEGEVESDEEAANPTQSDLEEPGTS